MRSGTLQKIFFFAICFLLSACGISQTTQDVAIPTPTISKTATILYTSTSSPTITPTQTLTPTPQPFVYELTVFFDKNLSGELDYDGEIPLGEVTIEASVDEETYIAVTNNDGIARFEFPPDFAFETIEIRFPHEIINSQNDHKLTTAVINLGAEKVVIQDQEIGQMIGFDEYERNKIDLFFSEYPFSIQIDTVQLGLAHGEATYWIREQDIENTCILSYVDLNVKANAVRNYEDVSVRRPDWGIGKIPPDWNCASDYGSEENHQGIDTTFLDKKGIVVSPYLGVLSGHGSDAVWVLTKFGGYSTIGHCIEFIAEEGQPVYPGDPICIAGERGLMPEHVHVTYKTLIPLINGVIPFEVKEPFIPPEELSNLFFEIPQNSFADFVIKSRSIYPSGYKSASPYLDFFWYEGEWILPEQSELRPEERCISESERSYCLLLYRGLGARQQFLLHPSEGVFAAGNELVPPEIFSKITE